VAQAAAEPVAPRPEPKPEAKAAAPAEPPASVPAAATGAAKPGAWVVQVVALQDRAVATSLVTRLTGKGYPAFLVTSAAGSVPRMYKVQVGRYNDRREAEQVRQRLEKEEQFKPWISR
jgi:cell division septation protein DedD